MSVPYSINQGNLRLSIESYNDIYYVSGQGGIIIYSQKLQSVTAAGVIGAYSDNATVAYDVSVVNVNLTTGTVGTQLPQTNGIQIFVQQIVGGSVTEAPTGTISGVITLIEEGN